MKKMIKNVKGQMLDSGGLVLGFVTLAITAVVGALVLQSIRDAQPVGTAAQNGTAVRNLTAEALTGFNNFSSLLGVVGLVIVAGLVLGLIMGAFARRS